MSRVIWLYFSDQQIRVHVDILRREGISGYLLMGKFKSPARAMIHCLKEMLYLGLALTLCLFIKLKEVTCSNIFYNTLYIKQVDFVLV